MGSLANYIEDKFLDHLVGKTSYAMPTAYVGLSTADPLDDASGLAEPSGMNYARQSTLGVNWNAASGGSISNLHQVNFPEASGDWGTITHFALFDAVSGGNMLGHGTLTTSRHIESGEIGMFRGGTPGDLVLTLG